MLGIGSIIVIVGPEGCRRRRLPSECCLASGYRSLVDLDRVLLPEKRLVVAKKLAMI